MNNIRLVSENGVSNIQKKLWYVDNSSEIILDNFEAGDRIYSINDNKLFQIEYDTSSEQEYSGEIVSFEADEDDRISSVIAEIKPIQDLHGYANPWPAGGGKNKACDIFSQYTKPDNYYILPVDLSASSTWQFHATLVGSKISGIVFGFVKDGDRYSNFVGLISAVNSDGNAFSYNINVDSSFVSPKLVCYCSGEAQFNQIFENYHIQLEAGSTPTSFAPYANECPISGYTGLTVARMGKNILPTYSAYSAANVVWGGTFVNDKADGSFILPEGTYTFSCDNNLDGIYIYDKDGTRFTIKYNSNFLTFTNPKTQAVLLRIYKAGVTAETLIGFNYQLEVGSIATSFAEYTPTTIPISWQTEAGTVYGGSDEIIGGALTSTLKSVDMGDLNWKQTTIGSLNVFYADLVDTYYSTDNTTDFYCDRYASRAVSSDGNAWINRQRIFVVEDDYATAADFKTAMSGAQLVYMLATPAEYTLSANELSTLYGTNNVWTDAGEINVKVIKNDMTTFELKPHI